jgi:hypothetical protein
LLVPLNFQINEIDNHRLKQLFKKSPLVVSSLCYKYFAHDAYVVEFVVVVQKVQYETSIMKLLATWKELN